MIQTMSKKQAINDAEIQEHDAECAAAKITFEKRSFYSCDCYMKESYRSEFFRNRSGACPAYDPSGYAVL